MRLSRLNPLGHSQIVELDSLPQVLLGVTSIGCAFDLDHRS